MGEEFEDLGSYVVSLYAFQNGLCIAANSSYLPKGIFTGYLLLDDPPYILIITPLSEGPWSVAVTEVDGERTNTMEYEAKVKGEEWVNHAYEVKTEYMQIFSCPVLRNTDLDGAHWQVRV